MVWGGKAKQRIHQQLEVIVRRRTDDSDNGRMALLLNDR
jgi:hypothetical protein